VRALARNTARALQIRGATRAVPSLVPLESTASAVGKDRVESVLPVLEARSELRLLMGIRRPRVKNGPHVVQISTSQLLHLRK
jgi:hypothetical protein